MTWPAVLLWILIVMAVIVRGPFLLYLLSACVVFGSLTMLPSGGTNLPPEVVCAALLVATTFLQRRRFVAGLSMASDLGRLGFLALFLVYGVVSAFLFSRLFAGRILVVFLNNPNAGLRPESPSSSNFNEVIYLSLSIGIAFAFATLGQSARFRRNYLRATLAGAILLVVSGILDLILTLSGHADLLTPFHNAVYAQLTDVKQAGELRVVGFMPEASAYGEYCVSLTGVLVFCYSHFEARLRRVILPATIAGLVVMTILSTSSTGFLGLIVIIMLFFLKHVVNPLRSGRLSRVGFMLSFVGIACVGLFFSYAVLFAPRIIAGLTKILDVVLLDKTQSLSYIERSSWTRAGLHAFVQSGGIGVGIGSLRTSDWFVNLLASTGIVGVLLFVAGIVVVIAGLRRQPDPRLRDLGGCLIWAVIPFLAVKIAAGTTPDPGVFGMAILGLIAGLGQTRMQPRIDQGMAGTTLYSEPAGRA